MVTLKEAGPLIGAMLIMLMGIMVMLSVTSTDETPVKPKPSPTVVLEQAEWVKE